MPAIELVHVETEQEKDARLRQTPPSANNNNNNNNNNDENANQRRLILKEDAAAILARFPVPLHVITVTGKARLGKSTLLNLILRHFGVNLPATEMFKSAAGSNTVTSGIWMWSEPIRMANGEHLLLLDSEGTERGNDTITAQLTAIGCFFSSLLVLHLQGDFSNAEMDALARMQAMVAYARGQGHELLYPVLLIASRSISNDWIKAEFPGQTEDTIDLASPEIQRELDKKLDKQLQEQPGQEARNGVRKAILEWFHTRHYQISLETDRSDREPLQDSRLVPNSLFAKSMNTMIQRILALSKPKQFGNLIANSQNMVELLRRFVEKVRTEVFSIPDVLYFIHYKAAREIMAQLMAEFDALIIDQKILTMQELTQVKETNFRRLMQKLEDDARAIHVAAEALNDVKTEFTNDIELSFLRAQGRILEIERKKVQDRISSLQDDVAKGKVAEGQVRQELGVLQKTNDELRNQTSHLQKLAQDQADSNQRQIAEIARLRQQVHQASKKKGGGFCMVM